MQIIQSDPARSVQPILSKCEGIDHEFLNQTLAKVWALADKHNFSSKSLYSCVDFAERFLTIQGFSSKQEFEEFWFVCLYIAAKVEEVTFPCYKVYLERLGLNRQKLLTLEHHIISVLQWKLTPLYTLHFFDIFISGMGLRQAIYSLGQQLIELLAATNRRTLWVPSLQAAGISYLCLNLSLSGSQPAKTTQEQILSDLSTLTGFPSPVILDTAHQIAELFGKFRARVESGTHNTLEQIISDKYHRGEYSGVGACCLSVTVKEEVDSSLLSK